jgi:hypothetical protein
MNPLDTRVGGELDRVPADTMAMVDTVAVAGPDRGQCSSVDQ